MKIEKLFLSNHPFFGNQEVSFKDSNGKVLNTIVFAGNNGNGKTTILETIFDIMTNKNNEVPKCYVEIGLQNLIEIGLIPERLFEDNVDFNVAESPYGRQLFERLNYIDKQVRSKVIFMPTETAFDRLNTQEKSYEYHYSFKNIIDRKMINDVPSYISSKILDSLMENENMTAKEATKIACDEINSIFKDLEIDAEMSGLRKDGEKIPLFRNSSGKEFDINGLSSGEKQLFVRALTLKMINANNSIILIDEPEISLHPKWQQKILKVYETIGENNQIIIATHSPHIVSSAKPESVFLLNKDNGIPKIYNYEQLSSVHGKPMNIVLDFMGLETDRDPEVEKLFDEVRKMVEKGEFESDKFSKKIKTLTDIVGEIDRDVILIKMEIAKRKAKSKEY
jgi:predicted ATP-binding protein involved in virulence